MCCNHLCNSYYKISPPEQFLCNVATGVSLFARENAKDFALQSDCLVICAEIIAPRHLFCRGSLLQYFQHPLNWVGFAKGGFATMIPCKCFSKKISRTLLRTLLRRRVVA